MANVNAPNGFQYFGRLEGGAPTAGLTQRLISSGDTSAVGYGDCVTSLSNGYVSLSANNTTQINGIFYGCEYLSTALGRTVWSNFYPGSGAGGDVKAYLCNDPEATFIVQSDNTAFVMADIGLNVGFVAGTVNTVTGASGQSVGQSTHSTTATLPFRIVGLLSQSAPPGTNGTDNTSANNRIVVTANNWDRKSLTGI